MLRPKYLTSGSVIGITAPAGYVSEDRVAYAVTVLEKWGFRVQIGATIGTGDNYFSGTDQERLSDLQAMLDNPDIDAILMGRGGYGMSRIIDQLDFHVFTRKPKWVCGFSDITVLHNHLQANYGIASLHSPMCGAFSPETEHEDHIQVFRQALMGGALVYNAPMGPFNRPGKGSGILTGGNLAMLAHLTGSASEVDTTGKILMIEDIGEHLYKIDRLMLNLKRAGKLEKLAGLIVGGFTEIEDTTRPFGQTVEEIIADKVAEYDYPVCFNFPVGHQDINYTLTLGAPHLLTVKALGSELKLQPDSL